MSQPSPCPICEAPVEVAAPTFPFCSSRCRLIDLGRWADQRYAVAGAADPDEPSDEEVAPPDPEDE